MTVKFFAATTLGLAWLTLVAGSSHAAELIINGSFESASAGASLPNTGGGEQLTVGSTALAGWTVVGSNSGHDMIWLTNTNNAYGLSTPFGTYFLDLTGFSDAAPYTGVTQTIPTVVGGLYTFSFNLGVDQSDGRYSGPVGVTASAGLTSQTFINYNPTGTGNLWQSFGFNFLANSTSTAITITGMQGNQYIGLDSVSVTGAVPEPTTWAAVVGGVGVMGIVWRRRSVRD